MDFDVLWIDMNEVDLLEDIKDCDYVEPKYLPEKLKPLHQKTLCYNAQHYLGMIYLLTYITYIGLVNKKLIF